MPQVEVLLSKISVGKGDKAMFAPEVYSNTFFEESGFVRKQCPSGAWFWTLNPDQRYSGDQDDVEYTFIGKQVFAVGALSLADIRKRAVAWFRDESHTPVLSYPVLASLWRSDLLFVSASVCAFQPHVIERRLLPPANPLVVAQKCVRLNDLENVGRSGRHLSSFTMLGHHAFNFEDEPEIYWIARTVELCHRFFTEALGADPMGITYVESVWAGGGNAGPCVEVMYEGLEIATLVFMNLEEHPDGDVEYKGINYRTMPTRVVDTGYGLERIAWASQGSPNIYAAVSPEFLEKIVEHTGFKTQGPLIDDYFRKMSSQDVETPLQYEKVQTSIAAELDVSVETLAEAVRPAEVLFTLCDFTRTILLMLHDHVLPSHKDAGYLVRQLIKRLIGMLDAQNITLTPMAIVGLQFDCMLSDFPELEGLKETALDIVHEEVKRHRSTMQRGYGQLEKEIKTLVKKKRKVFPNDRIYHFYTTSGLPLTTIRDVVRAKSDLEFNLTDEAWKAFFKNAQTSLATEPRVELPSGMVATERLYDHDPYLREHEATVVGGWDDWIALDRTLFYPDGGGQPADRGFITVGDARLEVLDVREHEGTVFHRVSEGFEQRWIGELATLKLDWERRYSLMRAHSATHLLNATLKEVLGPHIRQRGAQKGVETSRFDIAHYRTITPEQVQEIEARINARIFEGARIQTQIMARGVAEETYGFFIYQGGFVARDQLRIVTIEGEGPYGLDTEACAGTHLKDIREVSLFKLLGVSAIQSNVYRLRYSVGPEALRLFQSSENVLTDISQTLGTPVDVAQQRVSRLVEENKSQNKRLGDVEGSLIALQAEASRVESEHGLALFFFRCSLPKDRALRHIVRLARSNADQAFFAIFKDGAVFVRSKNLKTFDLGSAVDRFKTLDVLRSAPDMIVFGGSPEAGAAWDLGRQIINVQSAK